MTLRTSPLAADLRALLAIRHTSDPILRAIVRRAIREDLAAARARR